MKQYDVIIVGGGIIGSFIYRDCCLRGLTTLLLERNDFGSGTTSGSSKLAHGGIRYLSNVSDWKLVIEALRERKVLRKIAPHLVHELDFLLPVYDGSLELPGILRPVAHSKFIGEGLRHFIQKSALSIGLTAYDCVAGNPQINRVKKGRLPPGFLHPHELVGIIAYDDAKIRSPERLCLEAVLDGDAHGGESHNYSAVTSFIKNKMGKVNGVRVGKKELYGTVIVNATGPQIDAVNEIYEEDSKLLLRVGGIHVVVPPFRGADTLKGRALVVPSGNRIIFLIPENDHWIIGTTETKLPGKYDSSDFVASKKDVKYLFDSVRKIVPQFDLTPKDVLYAYAGVRPLTRQETSLTYASRKDLLDVDLVTGVISVSGKLTPARHVAEKVTTMVGELAGWETPCETALHTLPGGGTVKENAGAISNRLRLSPKCAQHLIDVYGSRAIDVCTLAEAHKDLRVEVGNHHIAAEAVFAVKKEKAHTLSDVMLRRTSIGPLNDPKSILAVLAKHCKWSKKKCASELKEYNKEVKKRFGIHSTNF